MPDQGQVVLLAAGQLALQALRPAPLQVLADVRGDPGQQRDHATLWILDGVGEDGEHAEGVLTAAHRDGQCGA